MATRYRTTPILGGMAIAFMAKMAVAVLAGKALSQLPPLLVAAITTVNFFAIAYALWRKPDRRESRKEYPTQQAMMVSFAAIFFSEWGDIGQVTAATMAARFGSPVLVWAGAVGAMITKGALATLAGGGIRRWTQQHVSPKTVRYAAVGVLLLLGLLSVAETLADPPTAPSRPRLQSESGARHRMGRTSAGGSVQTS
ncbi:MAG: TMEM165/GDT1 family protein [Candidatus Solibacter sp.]|nr:TMEM165/GDT1 family protein [Candidatus Solibacter sp.]